MERSRLSNTEWMNQGYCRDRDKAPDPSVFHIRFADFEVKSDYYEARTTAKRVCAECPVKLECLEYAVTNGIKDGVWGGLDEKERKELSRSRRLK